MWNRIKEFFKNLFKKPEVLLHEKVFLPRHYTSSKKRKIQKINGANKIYNQYLRFGKIFAQQAANAYYMKGRLGLREFLKPKGE